MKKTLAATSVVACLVSCTALVPLREEPLIATAFVPFYDTNGAPVLVTQPGTRFLGYRSDSNVLIRGSETLYIANGRFIIPDDGGMNPNEWIMTYRLRPDSGRMPEFINRISIEGYLLNTNNVEQLITFVAMVAARNPDQVGSWEETISALPDRDRPLILEALWQADTPQARRALDELLANRPSDRQLLRFNPGNPPASLLSRPLSLATLDCLWSAFFATDDRRFVVRLMQALPMGLSTNVTEQCVVGAAAKWSLTANAAKFPDVLTICREELGKQAPAISQQLQTVITETRGTHPRQRKPEPGR